MIDRIHDISNTPIVVGLCDVHGYLDTFESGLLTLRDYPKSSVTLPTTRSFGRGTSFVQTQLSRTAMLANSVPEHSTRKSLES
jgi:hypothetical protein